MSEDVRKFLVKFLLFVSPFIFILAIEMFVLPSDYFTFRVWESVTVKKMRTFTSGPFYSNMHITKVETGDLAPHTDYAVQKNVTWTTDRYGFRNVDSERNDYDIVIIGDSMTAGTSLDQPNTLAEVLHRMTGKTVYSYAPMNINEFLSDERFKQHPPKIVIIESSEKYIANGINVPNLAMNSVDWKSKMRDWIKRHTHWVKENSYIQSFIVVLDRLTVDNMLNSLKSRISSFFSPKKLIVSNKMLFLDGAEANQEISREKILHIVSTIESYKERFGKQNICFIYLPIPNKENIYYQMLQGSQKPHFLSDLIHQLKARDILVVNTQNAFENTYEIEHKNLYQLDDTHWNTEGVNLTAQLLLETLKKCPGF